jgi:hypothetical protein
VLSSKSQQTALLNQHVLQRDKRNERHSLRRAGVIAARLMALN